MPPTWAMASTCNTPGITGLSGKWPWKNGSFIVTFLTPVMLRSSMSMMRSTNKKG